MIDYYPQKLFDWFVQEVANMRRKGDVEGSVEAFGQQRLWQVYRSCRAADKSDVHER